jgi:GGDEF domain-containing protein
LWKVNIVKQQDIVRLSTRGALATACLCTPILAIGWPDLAGMLASTVGGAVSERLAEKTHADLWLYLCAATSAMAGVALLLADLVSSTRLDVERRMRERAEAETSKRTPRVDYLTSTMTWQTFQDEIAVAEDAVGSAGRTATAVLVRFSTENSSNASFSALIQDLVTQTIAHTIHSTMRRDEAMFRRVEEAGSIGTVQFGFLLNVDEWEALHFVVRLQRQMPKVTTEVRRILLEACGDAYRAEIAAIDLSVVGAVRPIEKGQSSNAVIDDLDTCLAKARSPEIPCGVVWWSLTCKWEAIRNALLAQGAPVATFREFNDAYQRSPVSRDRLAGMLDPEARAYLDWHRETIRFFAS